MPAASGAGTLAYLELLAGTEAQLVDTAEAAVVAADRFGREQVGKPFTSIAAPERVRVVTTLAEREKVLFKRLRDYVYEGYYLQPQVWARLGYGSSFTTGAGVNPTSTIGALALRAADGIWRQRREWR